MSGELIGFAVVIFTALTIVAVWYWRGTRPEVPRPMHRRQYDGARPIEPGFAPSTKTDPAPTDLTQPYRWGDVDHDPSEVAWFTRGRSKHTTDRPGGDAA